jgi:hypothetical protein
MEKAAHPLMDGAAFSLGGHMAGWCAPTCVVSMCLLSAMGRTEDLPSVSLTVPGSPASAPLPPPGAPDAASMAEGYFAVGSWRIGMPREEALGKFQKVEPLEGDLRFTAIADTHFAPALPAELSFADGRLQTVKLQLYEGTDLEQAVRHMMNALLYMNDHFGGSNFEGGLKTHEDPKGDRLFHVLSTMIDKFDASLLSTEQELRKKRRSRKREQPHNTAYEMVLSFSAELGAANNFLLGQFRYRSDLERSTVILFDDRQFVPVRIPDAMVHLFSVDGERPPRATKNAAPE